MFRFALPLAVVLALSLGACKSQEAATPKAKGTVAFKGLKDGGRVKSPLEVCMTVEGLKVEPAGEVKEG